MPPDSAHRESVVVAVFREQRQRLWQFLLRGAGTPDAAEDLLQEAFLRVWDHRDSLGARGAEESEESERITRQYLWRVARNLMIDEIRARQRTRARLGGREVPLDDATSSNPAAEQAVETGECLQVMHEVVDRLPHARSRRCLQLWLRGRSLVEIAEEVRLGAGQVRGLLQRAKSEVILRAGHRLRAASAPNRGRS